MKLVPCPLTRSAIQDAIDAGPANAKLASDVGRSDPISLQRRDLSGSCPCCGFPSLVFPVGFRFGDPFALPLKHHFPLEGRDRPDHREHELAGRSAGVGSKVQDMQRSALELHPIRDLQEVLGGASEPVELRHYQSVALSDEIDHRFKLLALADRRYLFTEDLFASGCLQVAELGTRGPLAVPENWFARNRPSSRLLSR